MPNLICSVENCAYNKEHLCSLNEIHVGGTEAKSPEKTQCESFRNKSDGYTNYVDSGNVRKETEISCEATSCVYNDSKVCHAHGIDVCGCGASKSKYTACATFSIK